jgi:hypothetical protein
MNAHLVPAFSVMAGLAGIAYAEYLGRKKQRWTLVPNHRRPSVVRIDAGRDRGDENQTPKKPEAA